MKNTRYILAVLVLFTVLVAPLAVHAQGAEVDRTLLNNGGSRLDIEFRDGGTLLLGNTHLESDGYERRQHTTHMVNSDGDVVVSQTVAHISADCGEATVIYDQDGAFVPHNC